jgi:hypothetical protein
MLNGNKIIEVTEKNSQYMWMEWNTKGNRKNIDNLIHIQTWEPSLHEIRYTSTRMSCKEFVLVDLIHTRANIAA